ncbi:hypothetical protein GCM10020295_13340 [Streptomyces cinereospinus]
MTARYVRMRGVERATPGATPCSPSGSTAANGPRVHDPHQPGPAPPGVRELLPARGQLPGVRDGRRPAAAGLKADATRRSGDWNADRWLAVDLGASSAIGTVDLYGEAAYAVDYELQVSDPRSGPRCAHGGTGGQQEQAEEPGDVVVTQRPRGPAETQSNERTPRRAVRRPRRGDGVLSPVDPSDVVQVDGD